MEKVGVKKNYTNDILFIYNTHTHTHTHSYSYCVADINMAIDS
jgi:hypothetical protein